MRDADDTRPDKQALKPRELARRNRRGDSYTLQSAQTTAPESPERGPSQGRATAAAREEEDKLEVDQQPALGCTPEAQELAGSPGPQSDDKLEVIFHSEYFKNTSLTSKGSVTYTLHTHDMREVFNDIKSKIQKDLVGTEYSIQHCFVETGPGNDEIDIINLIKNKEDLESNYCKIMEAVDENSKLKVVAQYSPVTECNETEITTADDITLNSDNYKYKGTTSNKKKWYKTKKQKQENGTDLYEKILTKYDMDTNAESNQTKNGSDLNEIHLIPDDLKKCIPTINSRDSNRYKADKYESEIESNDSAFYNNSESSKIYFVGLVNQAMTCYLNSLLQALYMTPEFRNALYNWEYKGTEKDAKKNIPFQLQKLFLNLQTLEKAAETTALTYSFGWEATEAWNQHDIQELCRVMFDALEKTFKNTKQADFINRLYEGKILDYVKCLTCNLEKSREDSFLDIPLPLRSFDGSVTYGSVEEALEAFIKYETLEGNNQYFCEKCDKKSNAHKGLKFSKFPYILTLQLKRFDFDHNTYHRIKLNDKVTFPDKLNLNYFIASNQETPSQEEDAGLSVKCDDSVTDSTTTVSEESNDIPNSNHNNHLTNSNHDQDVDEGIDICNGASPSAHNDSDKMREYYSQAKGPYIYELFCIMIHSGSASGGHYYAYIKDFRNNKWWCFDDQRVSPITEKDIENTYGGGSGKTYYSSAYRSSTNAYMLMYRQVDNDRNALPIEAENFPPHLKNLLERMRKCEEDNSYLEQECLEQRTKMDIYFRQPKNSELDHVNVAVSMSYTVGQIAEIAFNKAGFDGTPDPERMRIVVYNQKYNLVDRVLDSDKRLDKYYENPSKLRDLMLEVRQPNEEFEPYPSNPIYTKVYLVNHNENELIDGPKYVRAYVKQSIREYKQELKKYFNIDPKVIQLLSPEILPKELMKDDYKLEENISENYPYRVIATEFYNAFTEKCQFSDLSEMSQRLMNTVTFYIDSSDVTKKELEKHKIPSLENYYREEKTRESASNHNCITEELAKIHVSPDKGKSTSTDGLDTVGNQFTPAYDKGNLWNVNYAETSNSEDSSLSDSDKTIVNEETTDNVDMIDVEAQSYISAKGFDVQQPFINKTTNGEHPDPDVIFKIEYLKKEKLWFITMSKEITEEQLKERLEQYIKVPKNYFKVTFYLSESTYTSPNSVQFRDDRKYTITLGRVLQPDENSVEIYSLRMDDSQALQKLIEMGLNKNILVGAAKHQVYSELRQIGCIDLPYERLRFVEVNGDDYVGEELNENDKYFKSSNNICIQELPPSNNQESLNYVQVYVRRWNRSKMQLHEPHEISIPCSTFSKELKKQVSAMSNISDDCLEFSVQVARKVFKVEKMESNEWKTEVLPKEVDFKTYVMYRDSKETPKEENEKVDWYFKRDRYSNTLAGASFARREKALKIHVDT